MAKQQEKVKKDNKGEAKAKSKGRAKTKKAAKSTEDAGSQDQKEQARVEQNTDAAAGVNNSEAEAQGVEAPGAAAPAPTNQADVAEVAKPKKRRPKRKGAKKSSEPQKDQNEAIAQEPASQQEKNLPQEEREEVPEVEAKKPAEPQPKKKSGSRRKGRGKKNAKDKEVRTQEVTSPSEIERAPEEEKTQEETPEEAEVSEEAGRSKKKRKPKKKGKKEEKEIPVPPIEEAPVIQGNKVVIASENPAKVRAVEIGFGRMFPDREFIFEKVSVSSGVSDQPMSDDETFAGALFRAQAIRQEINDAAYYVGLEGGLEDIGEELHAFAWLVILGPDNLIGKARTSTFVLPQSVADLVRDGKELGEADDMIFGQENSKHHLGAVGILTHGLIDRANYYSEAVVMALIPFKNPELYPIETLDKVIF